MCADRRTLYDAPPARQAAVSPRLAVALAAVGAALLAAAYGPTVAWLVDRWRIDPYYSHGPLIPLVSLALFWRARKRLKLSPAGGRFWPAMVLAAAALHLLGIRLQIECLSSASLPILLAGVALGLGGSTLLRETAFPLAYLVFAIPLPVVLIKQVSFPLQLFSSACAGSALRVVGAPAERVGVHLRFPDFTLTIADACSGLRSLVTVLALGALVAHALRASATRKLLVVAIGVLVALAANVFRIVVTAFIGLGFGGGAASAFFEGFSGIFFFAVVALGLLAAAHALSRPPLASDGEPSAPPVPLAAPPPQRRAGFAESASPAITLLVLVAALAGASAALRRGARAAPSARLAGWTPTLTGWDVREAGGPASQGGDAVATLRLARGAGRQAALFVRCSTADRFIHAPEMCSAAAGWEAVEHWTRDVPLEDGTRLPVNGMVLARGGERALLVYWLLVDGAAAAGPFDLVAKSLAARLIRGSSESMYVELSAGLPAGSDASMTEALLGLAGPVQQSLAASVRR